MHELGAGMVQRSGVSAASPVERPERFTIDKLRMCFDSDGMHSDMAHEGRWPSAFNSNFAQFVVASTVDQRRRCV